MSLFRRNPEVRNIASFVKNVFGYRPRHLKIYEMAVLHRSSSIRSVVGGRLNNERLEYLGDAVLGAITADFLFKKYPLLP